MTKSNFLMQAHFAFILIVCGHLVVLFLCEILAYSGYIADGAERVFGYIATSIQNGKLPFSCMSFSMWYINQCASGHSCKRELKVHDNMRSSEARYRGMAHNLSCELKGFMTRMHYRLCDFPGDTWKIILP